YEEGGPSRPGLGQAGIVHPVVVAVEVDRAVRPRLFQHHDRLLETVDLDPGRVLSYAGGGVVGLVPAGPDAELQPAAGQQVDGGRLLRHDGGVTEVVGQHQRADVQGGVLGGHGQRRQRGELVREVVGDEQGGVAEVFGHA